MSARGANVLSIAAVFVFAVVWHEPAMPAEDPEGDVPSAIWIKRIQICRGIKEREPVVTGNSFPKDIGQLFCFTEVRDAGEETFVTHNWYHGEELKASVKLKVAGEHWRTWSSKRIDPAWTGGWRVVVKDAAGRTIASIEFTVVEDGGEQDPELEDTGPM